MTNVIRHTAFGGSWGASINADKPGIRLFAEFMGEPLELDLSTALSIVKMFHAFLEDPEEGKKLAGEMNSVYVWAMFEMAQNFPEAVQLSSTLIIHALFDAEDEWPDDPVWELMKEGAAAE